MEEPAKQLQERREKISAASVQLVGAALALAGELINWPNDDALRGLATTLARLLEA